MRKGDGYGLQTQALQLRGPGLLKVAIGSNKRVKLCVRYKYWTQKHHETPDVESNPNLILQTKLHGAYQVPETVKY